MLGSVNDEGDLQIDVRIDPTERVSLIWGVRHVHDDGASFPMRSEADGVVDGDDTTTAVTCDGCGTQALVETSLTTEVTGLERLGLLTAVVTAANVGHEPPNHRFGLPVEDSCPLCAALGALSDPLPGEP